MEIFAAQLLNGLASGSIYVLVVLGFQLLLLVTGILQFSHGHLVVFSIYTTWLFMGVVSENVSFGIPIAVVAATVFSVCLEPAFRRLVNIRAFKECLVLALGISIIFTEVMSHFFNHGRPVVLRGIGRIGGSVGFGKASISVGAIYSLIAMVIVLIALRYFLYNNKHGMALRAVAQDINVARLLGIPINKANIFSFGIAGFLGGLTAVLISLSLGYATPALGENLSIKAMAVCLFAGQGNLKGGVVCALLLGLAESMTMSYLPGNWVDAIAFGMIMVAIIWRPEGVFGTEIQG
jgi:branched-chain amino acid transport system permease protein